MLELDGGPVTVLQTHFGLNDSEKRAAVETACEAVAKERNPVILMGDLNMEPDDAILRPLFDVLADSAGERDEIRTFPSGAPEIKIDYILHSAAFKTLSLRSMDTQNSDHRPLIATLDRA